MSITKSYQHGVLEGNTTYTFPHSDTVERVETYKNGNVQCEVPYAGGVRSGLEKVCKIDGEMVEQVT